MAVLKEFPHWESLTPKTRQAFRRAAELPFIREFYLAGGTEFLEQQAYEATRQEVERLWR